MYCLLEARAGLSTSYSPPYLSKGGGSGSRYWADLNSGSSYPQSSSNTERRTQGR